MWDTKSDTEQNVGAVHSEGDHQMAEEAAECEPVFEAAGDAHEDHNMANGEEDRDQDTNDNDLADLEELFYVIENLGAEDMKIIPADGSPPWSSLRSVKSAFLDNWEFHVGEVVPVRWTGNRDALAKVVDIKCLNDERLVLELAWYYTREEI